MPEKTRILLIDTPSNVAAQTEPWRLYLPMAALHLAKSLSKSGFSATIYDPKLSGKINKNGEIYYYGDSFDEIEEKIRLEDPDFVGVTNLFSKDFNNAVEICHRAKKVDPRIRTAVGGPHATSVPGDFLDDGVVDVVVLGEGEETVVDLAKWASGSMAREVIQGIAWKENGKGIIRNTKRPFIKDLDSIGFPDYSLIDVEVYFNKWRQGAAPRRIAINKRFLPVITSRGCPYQCCFCSVHAVCGHVFRKHSAKETIGHIKDLVNIYKVRAIDFEDDNLSFDRERFEEIVDGLLSLDPHVMWGTPNGVRADTLVDEGLLYKIKESGCQYLTVGVESGSQEFLNKVINKALDLKVVVELSRLCQKVGLPLNAFFIIGFPTETLAQIKETLNFANRLNRDYGVFSSINFAFPIKGTKMYDDCVRCGYLIEEVSAVSLTKSSYHWGQGLINTPEFSPALLKKVMSEFNNKMFCNYGMRIFTHPAPTGRLVKLFFENQSSVVKHFFAK